MGIRMVRQPSETPNITNIDDIIPFRYAYGDQNGYVIGKGTEISHTIQGNTFRINSGRVVLQGVETDIDANGVSFTIDNSSETRYFVVYYEVNLATQTTSIKLSDYSIEGYPTIDTGDDLTVNSSGIARTELYRFTATNSVINNIEKTAKAIEYSGTALVGYDISKGTVEERLTRLGFKEANVSFSGSDITNISTYNSTIKLTKIGNYVMVSGRFGGFNPSNFTSGFNRSYNQQTIVPKATTTSIAGVSLFTYGKTEIKIGHIDDTTLLPVENTNSLFGNTVSVEIIYLENGESIFGSARIDTSGNLYVVLENESTLVSPNVMWSIRSISGFYKLVQE